VGSEFWSVLHSDNLEMRRAATKAFLSYLEDKKGPVNKKTEKDL
jgi:hypothetical protein